MEFSPEFGGITVPLITPLQNNLKVDEESLRKLVNFVLQAKINSLFVMGSTGEFQYLDGEEQRRAIDIVVDETNRRVPVVAGVTGYTVEETIFNILKADQLVHRPDALVIAPLVYHSNRGIVKHFQRVAKMTDFPIILYNNIGIVKRKLKRKDIIPMLLEKLSRMDEIVAIKDSSGNLRYLTQILKYRSPAFKVLQGEESLIYEALKKGADGAVPSLANISPRLCVELDESFRRGKAEKAKRCQEWINIIHQFYIHLKNVPAVLKEVLRQEEIISNNVTAQPFVGNLKKEGERVRAQLAELKSKNILSH